MSNNTLPHKIAVAQEQKIPYMVVMGDRELANSRLSVRDRGGVTKEHPAFSESVFNTVFDQENTFSF